MLETNLSLKELKKDYKYTLTNTSGRLVGMIPPQYVDSLTRKLDDIFSLQPVYNIIWKLYKL